MSPVFVMIAVCFVVIVSSIEQPESEIPQFEAAFQGRCGHDSPCEQICSELHDGMFECDCKEGFLLHTNGYSCLQINSSNELTFRVLSKVHMQPDIIYQTDASFSATLDKQSEASEKNKNRGQRTNTTSSMNPSSPAPSPPSSKFVSFSLMVNKSINESPWAKNCESGKCSTGVDGIDDVTSSNSRFHCVLGKIGVDCQTDEEIRVPRFSGQSWLAFPALRAAYKHVQLEIEFRPESWNGILFLTGERDDLAGDFVAVVLHEGFIEFRFDCGSGVGVVRTEETVLLNKWNKLTIYRHRWDAWIQLNKGKHIQGRSKGLFSRITFREPVFIGGGGNTTVSIDKIPTYMGFRGCVRYLEINGVLYNFAISPLGDAISGFDVEECVADLCSNIPCKHGGKCVTNEDSGTCLCPLGFIGDLCETRLDLQIPLLNGSSFLKYHGLGYRALSWLDIEVTLKPLSSDGIVLYNGHKLDGMGDFIAIYMSSGHVMFTFDLGTGSATLRSPHAITLDEWHTLKVYRTGRYAMLQVDMQPAEQVTTPGAYTQLSLNLNMYLGGVPNFDVISPKIKIRNSFVGCVQRVIINEKPLHVLAEALAGLNIDNCPHPCLAKPCGSSIGLRCEPLNDSYKCVCERNCRKVTSNDVVSIGNVVSFNQNNFLHYTDPEINERIMGNNFSISLRFKSTAFMGLILWYGSMNRFSDFLSLGIENGYLHFLYNFGNGEVSFLYNTARVNDGHWHRVNIFREPYMGTLMVDNGDAIVYRFTGSMRQINANSGLRIGGVENTSLTTHTKFKGCISDFVLNSDYQIKLSWKKEDALLCG